mmetsp:Transcript_5779/g.10346  ORF Transcript_5779/g.10346 Transcript_5779/m.10346 type:complete len:231 (-) Transcript_5779:245-937(-)
MAFRRAVGAACHFGKLLEFTFVCFPRRHGRSRRWRPRTAKAIGILRALAQQAVRRGQRGPFPWSRASLPGHLVVRVAPAVPPPQMPCKTFEAGQLLLQSDRKLHGLPGMGLDPDKLRHVAVLVHDPALVESLQGVRDPPEDAVVGRGQPARPASDTCLAAVPFLEGLSHLLPAFTQLLRSRPGGCREHVHLTVYHDGLVVFFTGLPELDAVDARRLLEKHPVILVEVPSV